MGLLFDRSLTRGQAARLAAVPLGGILAAAGTPIGPHLLVIPFTLRGYGAYVQEWATPSITSPAVVATMALAMVVAVIWARGGRRVSWAHLGLWGLGLAWTLAYARTVALGAVTIVLLAAPALDGILPVTMRRQPSRQAELRSIAIGLVAAVALCLAVGSRWSQPPGLMSPQLESQVRALPAGTVVFNDYALGGWLLFADPELDPSSTDALTSTPSPTSAGMSPPPEAQDGWQETVRSSGASVALLKSRSALAQALQDQLGWTGQAHDATYVLLELSLRP